MLKKKFQKEKNGLKDSFKYALEGIDACFKGERNMKIHVSVLLLVIIGGFCFRISIFEWMICLVLFGIVLAAELINTAIEITVDLCMPNIHPKAKIAKDTAAGGVLVAATCAFIIGCMIFLPKMIDFVCSLV